MAGSPPLVRERLWLRFCFAISMRITPARAGKTAEYRQRHGQYWDHPRSCGKDLHDKYGFGRNRGSPPLVRERLVLVIVEDDVLRITPARAGKTRRNKSCFPTFEDHPRSCGKDASVAVG